jgi:hypothetical protein
VAAHDELVHSSRIKKNLNKQARIKYRVIREIGTQKPGLLKLSRLLAD